MIGPVIGIGLLMTGAALADPAALRAPTPHSPSVSGALGLPELSVGAWLDSGWGVAVEGNRWGSAFGASAARRWTLTKNPERWGVDASVAAGLAALTLDPGVALTVAPTLQAGWRGERFRAVAGLVSPAAIRLNGFEASLPLVQENWFLLRAGRTWLGVELALGADLVGTPALTTQVSAVFSVDLGAGTGDYARPNQPRPTPEPRPAPR